MRIFLGLLCLAAVSVAAETQGPEGAPPAIGSVEGTVSSADGRPVAGARVSVVGAPDLSTTAGPDGRFTISSLPGGRHRVRVELAGFGETERAVEVRPGTTARVQLALPFLPFAETVTVSASGSERKLADSPVDLTVLTAEELRSASASALDEALKQVPSFSLFRRTSSLVANPTTQGVSLRGVGASGASRTLVLLDGIPQNDAFGNWVYWDSLPQLQIESIEVAPSGQSHLYGSSAMAGVISIASRPLEPRTALAKATGGSRGSFDGELFGSNSWGPFAAGVGGSYFRTDGYTLVSADDRGPVDVNAASRHRTGNWRLEYAPSPGLLLFQNGRVFAEDRENGTPLTHNSTRETYLGAGLRASGASGVWQANVYSHIDDFDATFSAVAPDRASETLSLAQAVDYKDVGGNARWTRRFGQSNELGVGGDLRWVEGTDNEEVFIPSGANIRDRVIPGRQLYAGAYLNDVITPSPRWVVSLGLRADHWRNYDASQTETETATGIATLTPFTDTSRTRVTPRAGVLVHLKDNLALRGNAYGGFRAPSLNELYRPFRVGNVLTQANPNLGPERLWGGELGFNHSVSANLTWRVTGFWDQLEDPIANVTLSVAPSLITRQRQNLGGARIRGLSVDADYQPARRWRLQASYVLSDAIVDEAPTDPDLEGNLLPQVPRDRASLRLDYLNPGAINFSLRGRVESRRFDDDQNLLRLAGLLVVDLTLDRPIGRSWSAFVVLENLFDDRYPVQATPVELQGTPFTINAGLRLDLRPR